MKNNNKIILNGVVSDKPTVAYKKNLDIMYEMKIKVQRLNNTYDELNIVIADKIIKNLDLNIGDIVDIFGELRTYNIKEDKKNKLTVVVYAKRINEVDKITNKNIVQVEGFICKEPVYRITPLGRKIGEFILAINRDYFYYEFNKNIIKSSYIPTLGWETNAKYISSLNIGDKVKCEGRLQSRKYKKIENELSTEKTAYELSLFKIKKM